MFLNELEQEAVTTRKMLQIVPNDKYDWRPHPKSMTIQSLVTHIADIPGWISFSITTDELDFAKGDFNPAVINNNEELHAALEKSISSAKEQLIEENESKLNDRWIMRNGEEIWMDLTKTEVIRHSFSQLIHHRAQLGVFLRLLDIPIPGSYGPSADEMNK